MFGYGIDKKTLYIILAVMAIISLANAGTGFWEQLLLTLPGVIIAISFHEFAHAWSADKLGDTTPRAMGRLTLDPKAHLDPFGFVLLLFAGVGWGKPVEINPNNFTSNKSRSTCEAIVSFAGPAMNFILAVIFAVLYYSLSVYSTKNQIMMIIVSMILYTAYINIGLGVFNLIPLPPLDGEKIFRSVLPYNAIKWLDKNANVLQIIFMVLWITGLLGTLVSPIVSSIFGLLLKGIGAIFSLF